MSDITTSMEEELRKATEKLAQDRRSKGQNGKTRPRYDFIRLGSEIARAMVETAEEQVRQAESAAVATREHAEQLAAALVKSAIDTAALRVDQAKRILEEAHSYASDLRVQVESKERELTEMGHRLEAFGGTLREAHVKFCTEVMPSAPLDLKHPEANHQQKHEQDSGQ